MAHVLEAHEKEGNGIENRNGSKKWKQSSCHSFPTSLDLH